MNTGELSDLETREQPTLYGDQGWHFHNWGILGWIETVVKCAGWVVGILTPAIGFVDPVQPRYAQQLGIAIMMTVASFFIVLGIFDRIRMKEIAAMILIVINSAGHICFTVALYINSVRSLFIILFGSLLLVGELVKILFFTQHLGKDFNVPGAQKAVMYALVSFFAAIYIVLIVIGSIYYFP
jgi:hypothetical protein